VREQVFTVVAYNHHHLFPIAFLSQAAQSCSLQGSGFAMSEHRHPLRPRKKPRKLARQPTIDEMALDVLRTAKKEVLAGVYKDGSLLPSLANEHEETFDFLKTPNQPLARLCGQRTFGCLGCAGLGSHFIMKAITDAKRGLAPSGSAEPSAELRLSQAFFCDPDPAARVFANALVNAPRRERGEPQVCIFGSFSQLGEQTMDCLSHDRKCRVPDCDFLVVAGGYGSGSASSFGGLLRYLDTHAVLIVVHASTDLVADDDSARAPRNADEFEAELHAREFDTQSFALANSLFGAPLTGKHMYTVCFKACGAGATTMDFTHRDVTDATHTMRCFVTGCMREPPCALSLCFGSEDEALVAEELRRREGLVHQDVGGGWRGEHSRMYFTMHMQAGCLPIALREASVEWYRALSPRQKSTLAFRQQFELSNRRPGAVGAEARLPAMLDLELSVNVRRNECPVSQVYEGRVLAPSVPSAAPTVWLEGLPVPRVMLLEERLLIHGWPTHDHDVFLALASRPREFTWTWLSLPLPPLLAVLQSALSSMSWRSVDMPSASSAVEVSDAEAMLQSLFTDDVFTDDVP